MAIALHYVRFWGQSGHHAKLRECPLMTQSGHRVTYFAAMQSTVRSVMGNSSYFAGHDAPHFGQTLGLQSSSPHRPGPRSSASLMTSFGEQLTGLIAIWQPP